MQKLISAAALASALVVSAPAMAQDSDGEAWSGPYIGATIGKAVRSSDVGETVLFDTNRDGTFNDTVRTTSGANAFSTGFCDGKATANAAVFGCTDDKDGLDYSVRLGYDMQSGSLVFGALVDAGRSDVRDSVTAFSITPASYTFSRKLSYSLGARVRAGYSPGNILFYATGGGVYGRIRNGFSTSNGANSFANNGKTWSYGYAAGGGVEGKIAGSFTIGLEYLYTNYLRDRFRVNVGPGTAAATNPFLLVSGGTDFRRSEKNFDMHAIRLTTSVRF